MPRYTITGTYTYSGEVEAENEDKALKLFYEDLNMYYEGAESEEIELVEEDDDDDDE